MMIWVAICDGTIAKIFEKNHKLSGVQYLKTFTHINESNHEHGKDRPGRNSESAAVAHHAYEPQTDWHENQKKIFIKEICSFLLKNFQEQVFEELYFVAPEKLMSIFKENFENAIPVQQRKQLKIHVLGKDLTHATTQEINDTLLKEEGWQ